MSFTSSEFGPPLCLLPQASVSPPESKGETHSPAVDGALVPIPTGRKWKKVNGSYNLFFYGKKKSLRRTGQLFFTNPRQHSLPPALPLPAEQEIDILWHQFDKRLGSFAPCFSQFPYLPLLAVPEMEFLDISLTKDSSHLLHAFCSPFYWENHTLPWF